MWFDLSNINLCKWLAADMNLQVSYFLYKCAKCEIHFGEENAPEIYNPIGLFIGINVCMCIIHE